MNDIHGRTRLEAYLLFAVLSSALPALASAAEPASPESEAAEPEPVGVSDRWGSGLDTLADGPQVLEAQGVRLRVTPLKGLERPWALTFLPDGAMLVTERTGQLRRVNADFTLDPVPIAGVPDVLPLAYKGLMDVALHPDYANNHWVYFTYSQRLPGESDDNWDQLTGPAATAVLARGRYDGAHRLEDVEELFVAAAATSGVSAARIAFAADGTLFMSIGTPSYLVEEGGTNRVGSAHEAQDPGSHAGKILRLNDDGSVPPDNPFVGEPGFRPEIYALGVRNPTGLVIHPETGALWEVEHGPLGGDEINIVAAGRNYGWPLVSYGRSYTGDRTAAGSGPQQASPSAPGIEEPLFYWLPNIAPGGLTIYTGERFPEWQGDALIGGLATTQLHRVDLGDNGLPRSQQAYLVPLRQRIREVREGPDGLLYLLTDHDLGAVLKVEPAPD